MSNTILDFGSDEDLISITLSNVGEGTLTYNIVEAIDWLTVTSNRDGEVTPSTPASLTFSIDRSQMNDGSYERNVTLETNGGNFTISINVTVSTTLCAEVTELRFSTDKTALDLPLRNCGTGTLSYTMTTNADWITLGNTSGTLTNETDPVAISVSRASLNPGNYEGAIYVNAGTNGPLTVPVYLTVLNTTAPQISISIESISLGTSSQNYTISLTNTGLQELNWAATTSQGWLSVSPTSGTLAFDESIDVLVTVNRGGLSAGAYNGAITFSGTGATIVRLDVSMEVSSEPILVVSTERLEFGTTGLQRTAAVYNAGNGTLAWTASTFDDWLTVFPESGINTGEITVEVDRPNLAYGPLSGTVTINGGEYGTKTISIEGINEAPKANLSLSNFMLVSDGNNSGLANPGEQVTYSVQIENLTGPSLANDLNLSLSTTYAGISNISPRSITLGDLGIGETSAAQSFTFDSANFTDVTDQLFGINDGGVSFSTDRPGSQGFSVEFKAEEEDFFSIGSNPFYESSSPHSPATISFWVKANTRAVDQMLLFGSRQESSERFQLMIDSTLDLHIGTSTRYFHSSNYPNPNHYDEPNEIIVSAEATFFTNNWHHVAITIENGFQKVYVDGNEIGRKTEPYGLTGVFANEGITIGRRPEENDMYYDGKMDNLRFYNQVLSREEIREIYNSELK